MVTGKRCGLNGLCRFTAGQPIVMLTVARGNGQDHGTDLVHKSGMGQRAVYDDNNHHRDVREGKGGGRLFPERLRLVERGFPCSEKHGEERTDSPLVSSGDCLTFETGSDSRSHRYLKGVVHEGCFRVVRMEPKKQQRKHNRQIAEITQEGMPINKLLTACDSSR